ncbi:MAG: sigma 54-interacting transcriptional regulator, partial [Candidatus Rokuibacteriota bacterium]
MKPPVELIGESAGIRAVRETIGRLMMRQSGARRLPPLLIEGETGTGKGLLARMIHAGGPRREGPFVDVNCAAIPETLLEAELFGFERGAFTDARQAKPGLFQTAHRGTLFLDEIGLLPDGLQSKLLTVIEERAVRRLGSTRSEPVDVWIVTATNEDLLVSTRQRRFREDLYHRLAVLTVSLPPLRERGRDIALLAEHFLARACADYGLPAKAFGEDARAALLAYRWPGNVRELSNVMERVALLTEAPLVTADLLGLPREGASPGRSVDEAPTPRRDAVGRLERERDQLVEALRETAWNISRAAARLGIPRNTIRYRIEKHGLRPGASTPARRDPAPRPAAPAPSSPAPASSVPLTGATASVRWEQRRLTWLLATLIVPPSAPEAPPDTNRALEVLVEKTRSFGGRVEELSRTGIVAAFGVEPVEDAPRRAAHAAMAIQRISERARQINPERAAVAVSIHTGEFPVGQVGGAPQIDLGAKREAWIALQALIEGAEPDTIVVSAATAPMLARRFDLVPIGEQAGMPGPVYRLTGLERTGLGRRMARFVGRHDDLELLRGRLNSARRGHGQVVGISGDAGIGKSRLLFEFRQSLAGGPVTYLEGHCVSYGVATPYLPLLDMLRQTCRIGEADTPETISEKVRVGLGQVGLDPDDGAPYLLNLLGVTEGTERLAALSPEAIHARLFEILWQMSLRESRRGPLILAVEDLHWIDKASEAYLVSLVESLAAAPILLLLTYRPGYRPHWMEKSYATQMAIQPLAPEEGLSVVRSVLPAAPVSDDLVQRIIDKAEGNPFFLEELARAVSDQRDVSAEPSVPDTIREVLLARIDRLADAPRQLLHAAAILGRQVSLRLLQAVWEGPGGVEPHLRELTRQEFLSERPGGHDAAYVFKHPLIRDVARESLPSARRQALHLAAGRALEALYVDRLQEVYDRLAYHFSKSRQADKAVEYLALLAERAARSYAHVEAIAALEDAVTHVERLSAAERNGRLLSLVLRQAHSLSFLGRFEETLDLLLREEGRLERLGLPSLAGPYYFWLSHTESYLSHHERAVSAAQRALSEARECGDDATMGKAYVVLAQERYWAGQPLHGIMDGSRAGDLLERAGERWWLGLAHWIVGINFTILGAFGPALEAEARALAVGESLGDPRIQSYAIWSTGWIHALTGAWEAGIDACKQALGRAPDPVNTAVALGHLGYVYLEKGDAPAAIP